MVQLLSYIFSLSIIGIVIANSYKRATFLGVLKREYGLTISWVLIFVLYVSYMFGYVEYNSLLDLFCIGFFCVLFLNHKGKAPFFKGFLKWYILFLFWCIITIIYTKDYVQWLMMMVKLVLPVIIYKFSYRAFTKKENIWLFFEKMAVTPVYFFLLTLISYPFENIMPIYQYFGMAVMVFPLVMFCKTREPKYLLYCVLCLSGNIIEIKRTPLLGMVLMLILFFNYKYKLKALVPIVIAVGLFVISIIYVPAVRDRMFFEGVDLSTVDYDMLFSEEAFTIINTSGRSGMWETVIDKFYKGNELFGAGLGTMKSFLLSKDNDTGHFLRLHNDWLHLLCEVGWLGVSLLLMMFVSMIRRTFKSYKKATSSDTRLIAMACPMASVGTMIHMFFENCIGVFGYYIPFIFAAIFFRYMQLENREIIR